MNTRSRPAVLASSTTTDSTGGDPSPNPNPGPGGPGSSPDPTPLLPSQASAAVVSGASRLPGMKNLSSFPCTSFSISPPIVSTYLLKERGGGGGVSIRWLDPHMGRGHVPGGWAQDAGDVRVQACTQCGHQHARLAGVPVGTCDSRVQRVCR